MIKMTLK